MILGFHYHICYQIKGNQSFLPAHFGIFIEELSKNVDTLVLFLHEDTKKSDSFYDYEVSIKNIKIIRISKSYPAYTRFMAGKLLINGIKSEILKCDFLLLRGPSPLIHSFTNIFPKSRITSLVVGDYRAGNNFIKQPFYRIFAVKSLNLVMHYFFCHSIRNTRIAFNSEALFDKYRYLSSRTAVVNTTNIYQKDIKWISREPLVNKAKIKLLYVGRIDWAKGLLDLLEVLNDLNNKNNQKIELHIVGWDESEEESCLQLFEKKIIEKKLSDFYFFHGKKKPGDELYAYYKMADIFVLPSYQEGFPRTIWEAFANCLPVITTPVGSIPRKLVDEKHVLFCEVKKSKSIIHQIERLINNEILYQKIIKNGFELVKVNTIETQTKKLINFITNK